MTISPDSLYLSHLLFKLLPNNSMTRRNNDRATRGIRASVHTLAGLTAVVIAYCVVPASAGAQMRSTHAPTVEAVRTALGAAEAEAHRQGWKVSIAVVDQAGDLLGFLRLDGASPASVGIAQAKARSAARFRSATSLRDSALTSGRLALLALDGAMPVAGGVPIVIDGEVVGAAGASGATSQQDAIVAQAAVGAIKP